VIEERLRPLLGRKEYGPNCWNATINFFDATANVGYTEQHDMEKWLRLNTWSIQSEEKQENDILILRDKYDLVHSAVLIDRNNMLFFHKAGIAYEWTISTLEEITDIYGTHVSGYYWHRVGSVITRI